MLPWQKLQDSGAAGVHQQKLNHIFLCGAGKNYNNYIFTGMGESTDQEREYQWRPHVRSQGYWPHIEPPADKEEKGLE